LLVGLSLWELRIEDGSRIFLGGENLWAGGQKRATLCLLSYADSHSDQDLQCFHTEIDVVLGDMQARQELDSRRHSYRNHFLSHGALEQRDRTSHSDWRNTDQDILRLMAIADELQRSNQAQAQEPQAGCPLPPR
jgi:hypothetical protein